MSPKKRLFAIVFAPLLLWAPAQLARADTAVTASNESGDTKTRSGDARAENTGDARVGHSGGDNEVQTSDVTSENATNVQEGDNEVEATQSADSRSGDTVGGQVIGAVVQDGNLEIDATNSSEDVDLTSGDAVSANSFRAFAGLLGDGGGTVTASDVVSGNATNVQEGDNSASVSQRTDSVTGDAVGGQVVGAVTSGEASITLANTSLDVDITSGDAEDASVSEAVVGLVASGVIEI